MKKLRILHLIAKWGRPTDVIHDYIGSLNPGRFESILCSLGRAPDQTFIPEGFSLHFLGYGPEEIKGFNPFIILKLKRLMLEKDIDILHCHKYKSILYGTLAAMMCRGKDLKVIARVGSMRRSRTLNRRITNRLIFPRITKIMAISQGVRQDVLRFNRFLDPQKVVVIHNGIHLERFPFRDLMEQREEWPVLGTVGRLVHTKGQTYLLQAFSQVHKKYPGARLLFAGAGPLLNDLKKEAEILGIAERVHFLGFQSEVSNFLKQLDLFVFPSLAEGFGLAVVEAMATGLPVVASRVGGIPEILNGQPCGRLVEAADAAGLARAILDLLSRGEQGLAELGIMGRRRVEEGFHVQRMVKDIENLYLIMMDGSS